MASPFAAAIAAAAATADAILAEEFEFRPMTNAGDVNKRAAPDPGRAVIASLVGIYGEGAARAMSGPSSTTGLGVKTEQFAHISDRPFLSVRLVQFPDYMPRGGDHVLRKATAQLYRIAEPLNDGFGLVRLDLNHIAGV